MLINIVITNLEHESSFVRKAAVRFLSKLWQIQPNCWPGFNEKIGVIFKEETEAIVRRELATFILVCLDSNESKTTEFMLQATNDLDWEVKSVAFKVIRRHQFIVKCGRVLMGSLEMK